MTHHGYLLVLFIFSLICFVELLLTISINDLNYLKKETGFCSTVGNCFISITSNFIRDTNNNSILPIELTEPLRVQSLIPDSTFPLLQNWEIDLNANVISLTFDETVRHRDLNIADITLSNNQDGIYPK